MEIHPTTTALQWIAVELVLCTGEHIYRLCAFVMDRRGLNMCLKLRGGIGALCEHCDLGCSTTVQSRYVHVQSTHTVPFTGHTLQFRGLDEPGIDFPQAFVDH